MLQEGLKFQSSSFHKVHPNNKKTPLFCLTVNLRHSQNSFSKIPHRNLRSINYLSFQTKQINNKQTKQKPQPQNLYPPPVCYVFPPCTLPWLQLLGKALLKSILQPHHSGLPLGRLDLAQIISSQGCLVSHGKQTSYVHLGSNKMPDIQKGNWWFVCVKYVFAGGSLSLRLDFRWI